MTLFGSDSRYREKATIWRIFSLLPLSGPLAEGDVFRWFAANIPMDLGTGSQFTSDLDMVARLHDYPKSNDWFYRTWEVKVALLTKEGNARSLKAGKTAGLASQLKVYREFGAAQACLLDVFVCESGFMRSHRFPPPSIHRNILDKYSRLKAEGFGYQMLPFEHGKEGDSDVGLLMKSLAADPSLNSLNLLRSDIRQPVNGFAKLMDRLDVFFESQAQIGSKVFQQIVFCRACRKLGLIRMKDTHLCPSCGNDLIKQF